MKQISFIFILTAKVSFFGQDVKVLTHRDQVEIEPVTVLNSTYRECNLSVSPDGKELFFMSTRPSKINKIGGDGDLYKSKINENNEWSYPVFLKDINTSNGEDEPSLSADGSTLFFQSWNNSWMSQNGPYFRAEVVNGAYKNPVGLGGGIAQFFRDMYGQYSGFGTDGMAMSSDGNLFIVACGPDYYGQMDLYYSLKKSGVWTYPKIMGISTEGDERAVFIAGDNQTIYFSSDGHGGFGGLDIFKTTITNGKLGEIVNLGEPFNTPSDDQGFVITKNGNAAFLIRDLDIYFADLSMLSVEIKPMQSDSIKIETVVEGNIESPKDDLKINLRKAVYTVNFDYDSADLTAESEKILAQLKQSHTSIQSIKIIGHTDAVGSTIYNNALALKRVQTVGDWLSKNGFAKVDISSKGEELPLVANDSELNRKINRRVEILVE
jgi:outer membrane protein OmpA-like peptidoglycan-associated protein